MKINLEFEVYIEYGGMYSSTPTEVLIEHEDIILKAGKIFMYKTPHPYIKKLSFDNIIFDTEEELITYVSDNIVKYIKKNLKE